MKKLLIVVGVVALWGCGTTCPKVKATRCNGQIVETCGSNKKWQRALDCSQVKPIKPGAPTVWTCGEVEGAHKCVPGGDK
jgi:hypothetical protein